MNVSFLARLWATIPLRKPRTLLAFAATLAVANLLYYSSIPRLYPASLDRVLIVTVNTGRYADTYYKSALENQQSYSRCHGYGFTNVVDILEQSRHPFMQRVYALKKIFSSSEYGNYDYILWINRDAVFQDHRVSIRQRLRQIKAIDGIDAEGDDVHLFVPIERWPWLNTGVLLFRNSRFSKRLVDDWIKTYEAWGRMYGMSHEEIQDGGVHLPYLKIGGDPRKKIDIMRQTAWSCGDGGALIALLTGLNANDQGKRWKVGRYDAFGAPHFLPGGDDGDYAKPSNKIILAPEYERHVKIIAQVSYEKYYSEGGVIGWLVLLAGWFLEYGVVTPFIYNFYGKDPKKADQFSERAIQCRSEKLRGLIGW